MHHSPDCVLPPLDEQVHVIRHQTVCIKAERQFRLRLRKQLEHLLIVLIVVENTPPIVPPRGYVVQTTLYLQPGFSSHDACPFRDSHRNVAGPAPRFAEPDVELSNIKEPDLGTSQGHNKLYRGSRLCLKNCKITRPALHQLVIVRLGCCCRLLNYF